MRLRLLFLLLLTVFTVIAQDDAADLQALLDSYVEGDDPAVVLLVSTPNEDWVVAQGMANIKESFPVQVTDRFRIGSITKTYVSALVMLQVEAGTLSLDDTIDSFLPTNMVSQIPHTDMITLRHLLTMRSGLVDYLGLDSFIDATYDNPSYAWTAEETLSYIYGMPTDYAPDSDFAYSNTNYNLLQVILEHATGQSFAELVDDQIVQPLDLSNTYVESPSRFADGIVQGYEFGDDDTLMNVTLSNTGVGLGDGGIISTAQDMLTFGDALFTGQLVSDESLDEMLNFLEDNEGDFYGLGVSMTQTDYGESWGHDGATAGFQSSLSYLPDEEIFVIVLTNNVDSEILGDLIDDAMAWVIDS